MTEFVKPPLVAPPVPAPYLATIPSLPDELLASMTVRRRLTPKQRRKADQIIGTLLLRIDDARAAYQARHGVEIVPEPPLMP